MASRSRPEMIGFRVTRAERGQIETEAAYRGLSIAELCRTLVLPRVSERLRERLSEPEKPGT